MVLVIEDHAEVRAWLGDVLRRAGHVVHTAANGQEALAVLQVVRPAVIVSDLEMPVLDGWAFRRQQLASPDLCDIPFIVISAASVGAADREALRADDILAKPVRVAALLDAVARVAAGRRANPRA